MLVASEFSTLIIADQAKYAMVPIPPEGEKLEELKHKRHQDKRMWCLIKEVTTYTIFLIFVCIIAGNCNGHLNFTMNDHLHDMFDGAGVSNFCSSFKGEL